MCLLGLWNYQILLLVQVNDFLAQLTFFFFTSQRKHMLRVLDEVLLIGTTTYSMYVFLGKREKYLCYNLDTLLSQSYEVLVPRQVN